MYAHLFGCEVTVLFLRYCYVIATLLLRYSYFIATLLLRYCYVIATLFLRYSYVIATLLLRYCYVIPSLFLRYFYVWQVGNKSDMTVGSSGLGLLLNRWYKRPHTYIQEEIKSLVVSSLSFFY